MRITESLDWRLPRGPRQGKLTAEELEALRELPERDLFALLDRVRRSEKSLRVLRQQLAGLWVLVRVCGHCGGDVLGRKGKVYCSAACKQRAYEKRLRGE